MRMIDDRLGYGLFLDYYLSNLLMDVFIKEQNYRGLPIINKYIFFKYYKIIPYNIYFNDNDNKSS